MLDWNADEVLDRVRDAARVGIDGTTAAGVGHAKTNHPWKNITGTLEGSIQMRPAVAEGDQVRGEFGSYNVDYAIYQELGTRDMAPNPFLRPALDAEAPRLAGRIREALDS